MAARGLWGSLLGRRGSSASSELQQLEEQNGGGGDSRRSPQQQLLGLMRSGSKPSSGGLCAAPAGADTAPGAAKNGATPPPSRPASSPSSSSGPPPPATTTTANDSGKIPAGEPRRAGSGSDDTSNTSSGASDDTAGSARPTKGFITSPFASPAAPGGGGGGGGGSSISSITSVLSPHAAAFNATSGFGGSARPSLGAPANGHSSDGSSTATSPTQDRTPSAAAPAALAHFRGSPFSTQQAGGGSAAPPPPPSPPAAPPPAPAAPGTVSTAFNAERVLSLGPVTAPPGSQAHHQLQQLVLAPGGAESSGLYGDNQPQQHQQHEEQQQHRYTQDPASASELSFLPPMHLQAAMQAANAPGGTSSGGSPHGLLGLTALNLGHDTAHGGGGHPHAPPPGHPYDALMSELQAQAGLSHEQAAMAAALMQRFAPGPPAASPTAAYGHSSSFQQHSASLAPPSFYHHSANPEGSAAGTPRGLPPPSPLASPMHASLQHGSFSPAALPHPAGGGGLAGSMTGSAFLSPTAAAAAAQACAGGAGAGTLLGYGAGGPVVGPFDPASGQGFMSFDSFRSGGSGGSTAALAAAQAAAVGDVGGLQSGFGMQHSGVGGGGFGGGGGGLLSPSAAAAAAAVAAAGGGFLGAGGVQAGSGDLAACAHDGLDVPGTAQVAVHNVPFKWCNADLEALFKDEPGYLDAQLLFHENGRSKGVGVALFADRSAASEVAAKLSGSQADGRKLELVLMSSENHISFSCKQVAVLGLPWEYTAADVRALIEAAAEADGSPGADAGVEAVEVAYRDDGKSEGRAIATFATRRQAHAAIHRLHGKETLAGLRMRLFCLHEQQQRQSLLAHSAFTTATGLHAATAGLPGLMLASLALAAQGTATPSPRVGPGLPPGTPHASAGGGGGGNAVRQLFTAPGGSGEAPGAEGGEGGAGSQAAEGPGASASAAEGDCKAGGDATSSGEGGGTAAAAPSGTQGTPTSVSASGGGGGGFEGAGSGSNRSSLDNDQGPVILHVSGLMESVTREQLRELFSQAGEVTKVDIPDGGRSMGYGFITFSQPQAAEQAMLQFNNYPLGGGAIHVAYSTSATAKARQQALRQARKATLGWHGGARPSGDGSGFAKPGTPRGLSAAAVGIGGGRRGPLHFTPGVFGPGGAPFGGYDPSLAGGAGLPPARHSFELPGYAPPAFGGGRGGGGWGPGGGMGGGGGGMAGGFAGGGMMGPPAGGYGSHALGVLGVTPRAGLDSAAAAAMAEGHARHGMPLPAGAGGLGPAAGGFNPALLGGGGLSDLSTPGSIDQQLQLLMHMAGAGGGGNAGPPPAPGGLGCFGPSSAFGGPPGTPPSGAAGPAGGRRQGLLGTPPPFGMFGAGAPGSFSKPPPPGFFGVGSLGPQAGAALQQPQQSQRQVLVTGLPPGLSEQDVRMLFEVCGPLRAVTKAPEQDFALLAYDTVDAARHAITILDGTQLPSGGTLALQFTALFPDTPAQLSEGPPPGAADSRLSPPLPFGGSGGFGGGGTPHRQSFTSDAGAINSGSLFAVPDAGGFGGGGVGAPDLFGTAPGGGSAGFSAYSSGLYTQQPGPLRASSPLPPVYAAPSQQPPRSASSGNLLGSGRQGAALAVGVGGQAVSNSGDGGLAGIE